MPQSFYEPASTGSEVLIPSLRGEPTKTTIVGFTMFNGMYQLRKEDGETLEYPISCVDPWMNRDGFTDMGEQDFS